MEMLTAEDDKLVVLAKSARARTGAVAGAAVRDQDGRTYAASTVSLPSLALSALQAAVAAAVSSGVDDIEAAVVVSEDSTVDAASISAVRDVSATARVYRVDNDGRVWDIS